MSRRIVCALAAVLIGAAPAGAQSCLEAPLLPAGWLASVRVLHTGAIDSEYDQEPDSRAALGIEALIARDFHGPTSLALSGTSSGYDLLVTVYDENGTPREETFEVGNVHVAARLAFDLFGTVPLCPFIEAGGFRANVDGPPDAQDFDDSFGGLYAGTGWTFQPHRRYRSGLETSGFLTTRLIVIVASSFSVDGYYERGQELLPKIGMRVGGNAAWDVLFVGVDAGLVFPAADPDFWLRHNSADDEPGITLGLRAGVRF